jgi:crotonobetainyl-CoA:carnitine CoA-transferase CaiB-like acyl-CoA transferase
MPRFDDYTGEHLIPPYRILDLTDRRAAFCGRLLADYGADVVKVEPPAGDPSRRLGPYPGDASDDERSLDFMFYNTNKRSITLDLESEAGRALFRRLAADADVIIESFDRNYLYELGIGFDSLRADNSGLIMASVTPFGCTGEWADYQGDDLVVMAASGYMQITGEPDAPPVRQGNEHSHYPGAQYAAVGILAALYYRDFGGGGIGQHIDVSSQEALITYYTDAHPALLWRKLGQNVTRVGTNSTLVIPLGAYPCQDGWIAAGVITPREWDALAQWIHEVTGNDEVLNEAYRGGNQDRAEHIDIITALFLEFADNFTVQELFHEGQRRNLVFLPVNEVADLLADPQLSESGFWYDIEHDDGDLGALKYPLGIFHSEEVSALSRPAPALGADNAAVYQGELGLVDDELAALIAGGVI